MDLVKSMLTSSELPLAQPEKQKGGTGGENIYCHLKCLTIACRCLMK